MRIDRSFELEKPVAGRVMSHLDRRRQAYERFASQRRAGRYQARALLDSIHEMLSALELVVPFRTGGDRLEPYLEAQLRTLADSLREMSAVSIIVEGHTDVRGARRFNRKLALSRARSVRDVLVGAGVEAKRVTALAHGVEAAAYPRGDRCGYAFDRKVIVKFEISGTGPCRREDR
ncbi:MAG: OmpA family protein [Gammaproteobacteria bacterium]|nr:OmpA family protein [Gammaproteobacteria bacterium]